VTANDNKFNYRFFFFQCILQFEVYHTCAKVTGMAKVNICNVRVLDNPSPFFNPFQFEITFECLEDLPEGRQF
jgi:hypothetical protein